MKNFRRHKSVRKHKRQNWDKHINHVKSNTYQLSPEEKKRLISILEEKVKENTFVFFI